MSSDEEEVVNNFEIQDPEVLKHRAEFSEVKKSKGMEILFADMQYNFDKIRFRLHKNTNAIQVLQFQIDMINKKINTEYCSKVEELEDNFNIHKVEEKHGLKKFYTSTGVLGALGILIILLQVINLLFKG